jgi:peptidoglycan/LPS O-acetylase OafA/YrhL
MIKILQNIPQKLSRVTSGRKLISEIDGLRFIAIVPVMIQHMAERFERNTAIKFSTPLEDDYSSFLASRGFLGVFIFFVISGFILALPFASYHLKNTKKISLKEYFWRRITRLEPPYIFWMTVFFIVFILYHKQSFLEYLPHYLANITYTHSLIYQDWSPFNPPTWTLEIEIQFYILAPFMALTLFAIKNKTWRRVAIISFIAIMMGLQQYFKFYLAPTSLTILAHLHYFLIGFLLADIYLCDWDQIKRNIWYDVLGLISIILLITFWSWDFELLNRVIVVLTLFFFFYAAFKGIYINKFICNKWIMAIGGMCYTIYLIHLPLSEFIIKFTKHIYITDSYLINLIIQLLIYIPITICLSAVFFLLFEKPFMDKNWIQNLRLKFKKA